MTRTRIPQRSAGFSLSVATVMLAYALLYDNSTSISTAAGYSWTRLIDLPRQIRYLEFVGVATLVFLLFKTLRVSTAAAALTAGGVVFSALTAMSYLHQPLVGLVDFVRLVYMYLLPIVVFVVARELPWRPARLQAVVRFLLGWIIISASVSWFQYLYLGYPVGDDITGLNQDAHSNATLLLIGSLLLLADGLFLHRRFRILLAIGVGATSVLSSDLKLLFISPILVALPIWYYSGDSLSRQARKMIKRAFISVPLAAVVLGVLFVAFNRFDSQSSARVPALLDRALTEPQNFGTVRAYRNAIGVLLEGPRTFLLGVGPFGYSNPISMGHTREDGPLGGLTRSELLQDPTQSGEDARVTLATSLAVEFGVPAFIVVGCLYLVVLTATHSAAVGSQDRTVRRYAAVAVPALLLLLTVGTFSLFGTISSVSLSWPVMILAGATCRLDARSRAIAKRQSLERRRIPIGSWQGAI